MSNIIILSTGQEVEVISYLPIIQKATFAEFVANESFVESEEGIRCFSPIEVEINTLYAYIKFYVVGIEFTGEEGLYDIYDQFKSSGDYQRIIDAIPENEIVSIEDLVFGTIKEKQREMSDVGLVLNRFLEKVVQKIPDEKFIKKTINDLPKMINKIKPENLDVLKGMMKSGGQ